MKGTSMVRMNPCHFNCCWAEDRMEQRMYLNMVLMFFSVVLYMQR